MSLPKDRVLPSQSHPTRTAISIVELLVVLAILMILIALLLPAVQASRRAARQLQCQANLHSWGQALHAYVASRQRYPPAATWRVGERSDRRPIPARHSLFTYLLPYIDEVSTHEQIDLRLDWNSTANEAWSKQHLASVFLCPAAPGGRNNKHPSDYTMAIRIDPSTRSGLGTLIRQKRIRNRTTAGGPDWGAQQPAWDGLFALREIDYTRHTKSLATIRPRDVRDGTSHTIALIENAGKPFCYRYRRRAKCNITRFRWASPTIWMTINDYCGTERLINCHNNSQPYGFHVASLNALYADGSVRRLSDDIAADSFVAAITRRAGD